MRWMHLSHKDVGLRHRIQKKWIDDAYAGAFTAQLLHQLIIFQALLVSGTINAPNNNANIIIDFLIQLTSLHHKNYVDFVAVWFQLDHLLHDIDPLEAARAGLPTVPHQALTLDSWDDDRCYKRTSFRRCQLGEIYRLFDLPHCNEAGADGYLRIPTGCTNSRGTACNYRIHPEELFLFFMTRCKKNWTIDDMVNEMFGGWCNRWYFAWPWMLKYVDKRYRNILGHQGLLRFIDQFPKYFEAIQRQVMKPKLHQRQNGQWWSTPGLLKCPYRVCLFVDCKIHPTNVPFSGPAGDYEGAPRKIEYDITQEAIYTRYKGRHGTKIESAFMPNGISTIFGPVSCRRHDTSGDDGVMKESGLHDFLEYIQRGLPDLTPPYSGYGDNLYGIDKKCIRSSYRAYFTPDYRDEFMSICDAEMDGCRETIEWNYGKVYNIFKVSKDRDNFKLGKKNPVSAQNINGTTSVLIL
jgi:hypothetical protein